MQSLDAFAREKLAGLESRNTRRRLRRDVRLPAAMVERDGCRLLSFACNDYLGLSTHPRVIEAAAQAARAYGAGAGASRLVTGNHPVLDALESRLAGFKGVAAACVFGSGYLANLGVVSALAGSGDLILIDALAHACLWAGARLSGAEVRPVAHNDVAGFATVLQQDRRRFRRCLVLTDSVFSMDGDLAPLDLLGALCEEHDAWLLVDDAHGLGVLGDGRGAAHAYPDARIALHMGTLSKAAGSYGGYLCASRPVVDLLHSRARPFVYTTGLPPASAAAALEALKIMDEQPELTRLPLARARQFTRAVGLPLAQSAIVPLVLGSAERALAGAEALQREGFLVVAIRPPTVAEGSARLRLAFSAAHTPEAVDRLAQAVRRLELCP